MSYNGFEPIMPIWAPPTPPQDENDIYIDYSLGFLYEQMPIPESALPPVYVSKESNKRLKLDPTTSRKQKARKEESFSMPRSLFDRPTTAILKLRRELILQKLKGVTLNGDIAAIHRTLQALGGNAVLPPYNLVPTPSHKVFAGPLQDSIPNWAIHEDWAIIQVLQNFQDLPLSLSNISPGHIPNWDLVSDVVNVVSCNYRSPKLCRYHYEVAIVPREEGKHVSDPGSKQKQKKVKGLTTTSVGSSSGTPSPVISNPSTSTPKQSQSGSRPMKTSQMIGQDNNVVFTQLCNSRFETIKQIANKRTPTLKHMFVNSTTKNPKHIALLSESGIDFERPLTPLQVATNRAERIQREKQKQAAEQQLHARQLQQLQHQKQQQTAQPIKTILSQSPNMPTAQHHLSQAISAKISQINQSGLKAVSGVNATTVTQLSLNKALSQVSQQSLPQPILSQINISPQTIGSTNVTSAEGMPQNLQQTCSVVSVAALTPQAQKLIAAVSPAVSQIGGQTTIGRLAGNPNPQIYKQIILRQQQHQQQQQVQRQASPQIQMQAIPQTKQMANLGVTQQQPRFQIATVSQSGVHTTQSLIASGVKPTPSNIVTTLPVAVPMTGTQQRITSTAATGKPTQQIITRTIATDPHLAHILKRQSSGNIGQTQILVQQSAPGQAQSSQSQILQNPVTFVKSLNSPATLVTQSLTIPMTMTGMNIFTSAVTKVVSPTTASTSNPTASGVTSLPATQLRQIQLLSAQKRPQQSAQVIQQQLQNQLSQQLGQQNTQKITTATITAQPKGVAQIQGSPVGTFQIVHQSSPSGQNTQNTKAVPTTVTVQQLQQVLKQQGLVVGPHNISHAIHVSQSGSSSTTSGTTTLIPQSILTVNQSKAQTIESSQQSAPIAVAHIGPNQQTFKQIQVVSSASSQSQSSGGAKSIILSGQPIIQTSLPSQPQTVTFAIRAAQSSVNTQTQQTNTASTAQTSDTSSAGGSAKEGEASEPSDGNQSRQSPYATRQKNTNTKN